MERREIIEIAFTIGLYITIFVLIIAIMLIVKNISMFEENPITYGINQSDFVGCECFTEAGQTYYFGNQAYNIKNLVIGNGTG